MMLQPELLEFTNGMLWPALALAVIGTVVYLVRATMQIGSLRQVYLEQKGAVALFVMFFGLTVRAYGVWALRHIENHHDAIAPPLTGLETAPLVHLAATFMALFGVMCWLRVTFPEFCGWRLWGIAIFGCIGFGLWMAF